MLVDKYEEYRWDLVNRIPAQEYNLVMKQDDCELNCEFLGFLEVYKPLSELIPKSKIVIDFGCYLAAQSYFFADHKRYIGVDVDGLIRFSPNNATHYTMSIQDFIATELPKLLEKYDIEQLFAICSYVPDQEATELVRKTFPNVCCYYPSHDD